MLTFIPTAYLLLFNFPFNLNAMELKPIDFQFKSNEQDGLMINEIDTTSVDQKLEMLDAKVHKRFHNQIAFVMERVEHLESIVNKLQRILLINWQRVPGGLMYNLFRIEKNWEDAKEICKFFGGDLAIVDNEVKNNVIKSLIIQSNHPSSHFWIGVKTRAEMSNSTSNYSNFNDDSMLGGCTTIDQTGRWKVRSCNQEHNFICQSDDLW